MNLFNSTSFVTGGSNGIGRAICHSLAKSGSNIFFTYNSDHIAAKSLAPSFSLNVRVGYTQMDLNFRASISDALDACINQFGGFNILVNNAGINNPTDFDKITDSDWDNIMSVNL